MEAVEAAAPRDRAGDPVPGRAIPVAIGRRIPATEAGAADGDLCDKFGRSHRDLRLSVTDRCNLRCTYCMPEEGVPYLPRDQLLTFDEIERVARVAHSLGIRSLRLTGGEPLLRGRLASLVARLATIGFDDLAMTTNGMSLARHAPSLAAAGLHRVNISCDSLRPERFGRIRRRGDLPTVLTAMDAAEAAGLRPLKVNVVLQSGINEDEILDFAAFARDTGRIVRFIEYMPLDGERSWHRGSVVPGGVVLDRISARWPLEPVGDPGDGAGGVIGSTSRHQAGTDGRTGPNASPARPAAPAERFRFADGGGEIGIVRSVTAPFCGSCDRLRVTADGQVRNCLFSDDEISLRTLIRSGASDNELRAAFVRSVHRKRAGHGIDDPSFIRPVRSMSMIGG